MQKEKEAKLSLLEDDMISHPRGSKDPGGKHLEQLDVVRTVIGYKSTCKNPFTPIINILRKKLRKKYKIKHNICSNLNETLSIYLVKEAEDL